MSIAGCPVPTEGADPPDWPNLLKPVAIPDVTREARIPSMLDSFRFVEMKAFLRSPPFMLSKKLAGKLVSDVQLRHAA